MSKLSYGNKAGPRCFLVIIALAFARRVYEVQFFLGLPVFFLTRFII